MPRRSMVLLAALAASASSLSPALAAQPPSSPASSAAAAPPVAPVALDQGLAVLAESAAVEGTGTGTAAEATAAAAPRAPALGDTPAWKLARAVYADVSLRPSFDEAHARALAGGSVAADAPGDVRDLAETRAAVHGDDGAAKRLLSSLAAQLHVRGIVVVVVVVAAQSPAPARARVFLASTGQFDAATYAPEPSGEWTATVSSLARTYGAHAGAAVAEGEGSTTTPAGALFAVPASKAAAPAGGDTTSHPFYLSPWFWGAVGAAALGGVAVYFATKDGDASTIHLQLQVPTLK